MVAESERQLVQIHISAGTLVMLLTCCKLSYCSLWMITWIAAHLKLSYPGPIIPLTSGAPAKRACLTILQPWHSLASTPACQGIGHKAGCWIYFSCEPVLFLPWSKSMTLFCDGRVSVVFFVKVFFFRLFPWNPIFDLVKWFFFVLYVLKNQRNGFLWEFFSKTEKMFSATTWKSINTLHSMLKA